MIYPEHLEYLVRIFSKVPGISERASERLVLHISSLPKEERELVLKAIGKLKFLRKCKKCGLPTFEELCSVCSDPERDKTTVCVVEEARDAVAIEKQTGYRGLYHVLGGVISPLEGISPEDLRIKELLSRIKEGVKTVIIALNPTVEGEATAKYLEKLLSKLNVDIYRISCGIPFGGTLDMADELTIRKAFEERKLVRKGGE